MVERRKWQRFRIEQAALLKIQDESASSLELAGTVESASDTGVLFVGESDVPRDSHVEVTILLPHDIRVSSPGKVVRVEHRSGKIALAIECSRPFSESLGVSEVAPKLSIIVEKPIANELLILHCAGRIAAGEEAGALRQIAADLVARVPRIVIDLKRVDYIDSVGVGILAGLFTSAKCRGGDVKLLSPSMRAKEVLHRTRLDTVFKVFENESDAVAAFSPQRYQ